MFKDVKGIIRNVHRRNTDNTVAKSRRTKGQTTIYKTLHGKLKIEQHESNGKKRVERRCSGRLSS